MYSSKNFAVVVTALMTIFMVFSSNANADSQQPPETCFVSNQTYGMVGEIYSIVKEIELDRNNLGTSETAPPRLIITVTANGPDFSRGEHRPMQEVITISWFSKVSYGSIYGLCIENPNDGSKQWISQLKPDFQKKLFDEIRRIVNITDRTDKPDESELPNLIRH